MVHVLISLPYFKELLEHLQTLWLQLSGILPFLSGRVFAFGIVERPGLYPKFFQTLFGKPPINDDLFI